MRQGNDIGTQYRSAIYVYDDDQRELALASKERYQRALTAAGHGEITTEIEGAPTFYYAEPYHQQYLAKVPNGYCGLEVRGCRAASSRWSSSKGRPAASPFRTRRCGAGA